jgi:hypothetical protein
MDWTDEYNQIVCELMAQQVRKGEGGGGTSSFSFRCQ